VSVVFVYLKKCKLLKLKSKQNIQLLALWSFEHFICNGLKSGVTEF